MARTVASTSSPAHGESEAAAQAAAAAAAEAKAGSVAGARAPAEPAAEPVAEATSDASEGVPPPVVAAAEDAPPTKDDGPVAMVAGARAPSEEPPAKKAKSVAASKAGGPAKGDGTGAGAPSEEPLAKKARSAAATKASKTAKGFGAEPETQAEDPPAPKAKRGAGSKPKAGGAAKCGGAEAEAPAEDPPAPKAKTGAGSKTGGIEKGSGGGARALSGSKPGAKGSGNRGAKDGEAEHAPAQEPPSETATTQDGPGSTSVVAEVPAATQAGAPDAGVGAGAPTGNPDVGVCTEAQAVLTKYSHGIRRLALEDVGNSPLNRAISGKHVHDLGRRISVQGFVRMRYNCGWCHEWRETDPLAVSRWTNQIAGRDPLLAPVPQKPLYGSIAKSHLLAFLQAMKSGSVRWSDSDDRMVPAGACGELADHLQHGMYWQVLGAGCLDEPDALKALIAADNFDAGFALGETEMQLLRRMHNTLQVTRPPAGSSLHEAVIRQVSRTMGQRWSTDDLTSLYNFCKVVGPDHIEFLATAVTLHVETDKLAVRPSDFLSFASLAPQAPWLKVVLLLGQYFSSDKPGCRVPGPNGKAFGNQVRKDVVARLQKEDWEALAPVEAYVREVVRAYRLENCVGVSDESLGSQVPAFLVRTAKTLILLKELDGAVGELQGHERKLRSKLPQTAILPTPVWELPEFASKLQGASPAVRGKKDKEQEKEAKAEKDGGKSIKPDEGPALHFGPNGPQDGFAVAARSRGFRVGESIKTAKKVEGIRAGAFGTIVSLEGHLLVRWDKGSLVDGSDDADAPAVERAVPLSACVLEKRPEKKAESVGARAPVANVRAGAAFVAKRDSDTEILVRGLLQSVMSQLMAAHAPTPERFALRMPKGKKGLAFVARTAFKAGKLVFLPGPVDLHLDEAPGDVALKFTCQDTPAQVYLRPPPQALLERAEVETDHGKFPWVVPFWDSSEFSDEAPSVELIMQVGVVEIPFGGFSTKDAGLGAVSRKGLPKVVVEIPYLTTTVDVEPGMRVYRRSGTT